MQLRRQRAMRLPAVQVVVRNGGVQEKLSSAGTNRVRQPRVLLEPRLAEVRHRPAMPRVGETINVRNGRDQLLHLECRTEV